MYFMQTASKLRIRKENKSGRDKLAVVELLKLAFAKSESFLNMPSGNLKLNTKQFGNNLHAFSELYFKA